LTKPVKFVNIKAMKDKYTPVPGRQEGQVEVLLRRSVAKRYGQPTVDFDGLTEMVRDAGLPPEKTKIKLYDGIIWGDESSFRKLAIGGRIPLTNTIYSAVRVNNRPPGFPNSNNLSPEQQDLADHHTAVMEKLTHNVLRAAGVRGPELVEQRHEVFAEHAGDIRFEDSPR
jgi:hypothetical protein